MPAILPRINRWDPIEMLCCSRKVTLLAFSLKIILFIRKEILGSNGQLPGMPFPRIHAESREEVKMYLENPLCLMGTWVKIPFVIRPS